MQTYQILIVGGGNAGISAASQLLRKNKNLNIAIVEPSEVHYYQPAWTLVGAGVFRMEKTYRPQAKVMPDKVSWIKQRVVSFQPEEKAITLDNQQKIFYQYLIGAPVIQLDWYYI
ncbi:MAG: NAD(P)/FAD-dependent oxidoreductase [Chitinophagaceae bacterium]|nr:NAD(P)/FAD-dependent oxidoreductase [Chitinophagaceae bacterium]